jgi:DNA-directed RNA polymerase specialized sigma24 family protein
MVSKLVDDGSTPAGGLVRRVNDSDFERFVEATSPSLLRALAGWVGPDRAQDAVSEAMAYAWEHWEKVSAMPNPAGYLYRVGQSRSRQRATPTLPHPATVDAPDVEPRLLPALAALPATQRAAVWLVHGCGWTYAEVAEALDTSVSMVGNHVRRALQRLRSDLEVPAGA